MMSSRFWIIPELQYGWKPSCNPCSTAAALKNAAAAVTTLAPLNYCDEVQLQ